MQLVVICPLLRYVAVSVAGEPLLTAARRYCCGMVVALAYPSPPLKVSRYILKLTEGMFYHEEN